MKWFKNKKKSINAKCITFPIKHTVFALVVRHSDLVRNDFLVEDDNRVINTSPCESHTGHNAPKSTHLLNRILVGRRDDDDKQPRVQQAWLMGLIGVRSGQSVQPDVLTNVQTPICLRLKAPAEVHAYAVVTQ